MMFGLLMKCFVGVMSIGLASGALGPNDAIDVGQPFLARSMDPTDGSAGWASHGVAKKLFTVDQHGEIVTRIAQSVEKISDTVLQVQLKFGYYFSDGTPLDANHVAKSLMELNQKNTNAQTSLGAMNVTTLSEFVVEIESELVTHIMDAVLAEWVFVIFYKDEQGNFLFTGPYAVETFGESQIDLIPNPVMIVRNNALTFMSRRLPTRMFLPKNSRI